MQQKARTRLDETVARRAFEHALASYEQDFGKFFLARLFGCEFEYTDDAGELVAFATSTWKSLSKPAAK